MAAFGVLQSAALCQWFVLCDHPATKTRPHPVLGSVPICDRCDARMTKMEETKP